MSDADRRRFQRVTLSQPIRGAVGAATIYVLDASLCGVRIAHRSALPEPGGYCRLEVETTEGPVCLDCEIVRTVASQAVFHTGLEIVSADRQSGERLRQFLKT